MQPTAVPYSTLVATHHTHANLDGELVKAGYFRGCGVKIADSWASFRGCVIHPRIPLRNLFPAQKHISLSTLGVRNLAVLLMEHRSALFGEKWLSDATTRSVFSCQLRKLYTIPLDTLDRKPSPTWQA